MSAPLIKFQTGGRRFEPIVKVECTRETENSVWIAHQCGGGESRQAKVSDRTRFHDTWEAARTHLMQEADAAVLSARRNLELANAKLGNIKGMKPPKEPA